MRISEEEKGRNIWSQNEWKFPEIVRYQVTDPEVSEDTKQKKCSKTYTLAYHIQIAENQRQRENIERTQRKPLSIFMAIQ